MNPTTPRFVALGMYAFTERQQSCWQQLFTRFCELSAVTGDSVTLSFDHDPARLLEPGLWFGYTCGYPLMTQLKDYVSPFCVPLFDVPGTEARRQSTHSGILETGRCIETHVRPLLLQDFATAWENGGQ